MSAPVIQVARFELIGGGAFRHTRDFGPPELKNRAFLLPPPEGARFAPLGGRFFYSPTKKNAPLDAALPPPRGLLSAPLSGNKTKKYKKI
jgi:hypothetical protein